MACLRIPRHTFRDHRVARCQSLCTKYSHRCGLLLFYIITIFVAIFLAMPLILPPMNRHGTQTGTDISTPSYKWEICGMTRVHNAGDMLSEWIDYHHLLGVEHFFISNDCSTDDGATTQILQRYSNLSIASVSLNQDWNNCLQHRPTESKHFSMLFAQARTMCQWLGVWDIDEYMVIQDRKYWDSLSNLLNSQVIQSVRMAWWLMSSEGRETKPQGLIIENYSHGKLEEIHHKTIAKTRLLKNWTFSLWPDYNTWTPNYFISPTLQRDEKRQFKGTDGSLCEAPVHPLFLRHYKGRSFEEFMSLKGTTKRTSNYDINPWAIQPREKWLSLSFNSSCSILEADLFIDRMVEKMKLLRLKQASGK